MSKHTPGPWKHNDYQIIETKTEKVIANCTYGGRNPNNANDARLIAAAPELLQMLQEVVSKNLLNGAMLKDARAVIAKAKGENNE
jgi:hypothetical protein